MKRLLFSFAALLVLFITSCSNFSSIEKHRIGLPEQGDSVMHIFTNQSEQETEFSAPSGRSVNPQRHAFEGLRNA
jgi:hypothetical protein